jgi:hypothetical protein
MSSHDPHRPVPANGASVNGFEAPIGASAGQKARPTSTTAASPRDQSAQHGASIGASAGQMARPTSGVVDPRRVPRALWEALRKETYTLQVEDLDKERNR